MDAKTPCKLVRNLKWFVCKTIKSINTKFANQVEITFTDGSELRLEAEQLGGGLVGIVPYVPTEEALPQINRLDTAEVKHINAAGLFGGNALCGKDKLGDDVVVADEAKSNCPDCFAIVRECHKKMNAPLPAWCPEK